MTATTTARTPTEGHHGPDSVDMDDDQGEDQDEQGEDSKDGAEVSGTRA